MHRLTRPVLLGAVALSVTLASGPAAAQDVDFSGGWGPLFHEDGPERLPGPELADYAGMPVNDAARMRGDTYDSNRISVVTEYQCRQHGGDYSMRGLSEMLITMTRDAQNRLVAFHTRMGFHNQERPSTSTAGRTRRSTPPTRGRASPRASGKATC